MTAAGRKWKDAESWIWTEISVGFSQRFMVNSLNAPLHFPAIRSPATVASAYSLWHSCPNTVCIASFILSPVLFKQNCIGLNSEIIFTLKRMSYSNLTGDFTLTLPSRTVCSRKEKINTHIIKWQIDLSFLFSLKTPFALGNWKSIKK